MTETAGTAYEYKTIRAAHYDTARRLNQQAKNGWELVSTQKGWLGSVQLFLRRPMGWKKR